MSESTEQTDLVIRAITALGVFMAGFKGLASLFTMSARIVRWIIRMWSLWRNRKKPRRRRRR